MNEITLRYNPFEASAEVTYKGKPLTLGCMGTGKNSRLQEWLYDFLPQLKDQLNWGEGSKAKLSFIGTPGDFEDIGHAYEVFRKDNPGIDVTLWHINESAKSLGNRISDLRSIFSKMQEESPYEELKSPLLKPRFEKALNDEFEISVIATVSSGKSTLINAFLGQEILPARNEATTAKIAQIRDDDTAKGFNVRGLRKEGDENYVPCTEIKPATLDELERLNSDDTIDKIEITGNIVGIHSHEMRLILSDTPGPNNSRTIAHAKHIDNLIKADYKPMIMYILNATQLEITDDKSLLEKIAKAMQSSGKQGADRFLFVLNKADQLDPGKNEYVEKKVADSKKYLEKQFGIYGARIFPVSAQLAKVIRMSQKGVKLTEDEEDFLAKKHRFIKQRERHFSDYVSLSHSCKHRQEEMLVASKTGNDENTQALIYSGIPALEIAMDEYLEKYALTAKISKAVDVFKNIITRLDLKNKTEAALVNNEAMRKSIVNELENLRVQIENGSEAKKLKEKFDKDIVSIIHKLEIGFQKHETTINKMLFDEKEKYNIDIEVGEKNSYLKDSQLDVAKKQVEKMINKTQKIMQLQYEILCSDLTSLIETELKGQAQRYLDEYQNYVSGLMQNKGFIFEAALNLIQVAIPDKSDDLVEEFLETKIVTKEVERSKGNPNKAWYKPWTWWDKEYRTWTEKVETKKQIIKMSEFFNKHIESQFLQFFAMITEAEKVAKTNAEQLNLFFVKEIERLDGILQEAVNKEKEDLKSQEAIEEKIARNKAKAEWLSNFIIELDKVLEV